MNDDCICAPGRIWHTERGVTEVCPACRGRRQKADPPQELRYPCTYVELGEALEDSGERESGLGRIARRVPHFETKTVMLKAGEVFGFDRAVTRPSRVDMVVVTGPCLITHIRMGMYELTDLEATFAAPRRTLEIGQVMRVAVKCAPELFMLPPSAGFKPMEGVPHD